jgi:hypothetical protein
MWQNISHPYKTDKISFISISILFYGKGEDISLWTKQHQAVPIFNLLLISLWMESWFVTVIPSLFLICRMFKTYWSCCDSIPHSRRANIKTQTAASQPQIHLCIFLHEKNFCHCHSQVCVYIYIFYIYIYIYTLTHNENDLLAGFMLDILSRYEHTFSFLRIHF